MTGGLANLLIVALIALSDCDAHGIKKRELVLTNELDAPNGQARYLIRFNGQFPGPTLIFDENDDVEITVHNHMPFATSVHWHGQQQMNTSWSDGVPGLSQAPIDPGQSFIYRFKASPPGTYWYHSHQQAQIMDGMFGPLLIRRPADALTPWHFISNDTNDMAEMKAAARDPQFMVISDWSKYNSTEYLQTLDSARANIFCADSYLVNGKGWVNCPGHEVILENTLPALLEALAPYEPTDKGCFPLSANTQFQWVNDTIPSRIPRDMYYDCVPANGRMEVITVDPRKSKWVSFNFIATISFSDVVVSIDEHPMWVYEVDGQYIEPKLVHAIELRGGERYSVLVKLEQEPKEYTIRVPNNGESQVIWTWATMKYANQKKCGNHNTSESAPYISWYGANATTDVVFLDRWDTPPYPAVPPGQVADEIHFLNISHVGGAWKFATTSSKVMYPSTWRAYDPLLQTGVDQPDAFNTSLVIRTNTNDWVDLVFQYNTIIDATAHIIHKHGPKFWAIGTSVGVFNWSSTAEAMAAVPEAFNLVNPPYRDTTTTPTYIANQAWMVLRYQATNPGPWLLHCHIETHVTEGFAMAILDGVDDWPIVPPEYAIGKNGY